jgi:hypothetical protein
MITFQTPQKTPLPQIMPVPFCELLWKVLKATRPPLARAFGSEEAPKQNTRARLHASVSPNLLLKTRKTQKCNNLANAGPKRC